MPRHTDFLHEVAETISTNRPYPIEDWFTEDFTLHDPNLPEFPTGHRGASVMMNKFRELGTPIHLEVIDVIEDGDRAAVRWHLSATRDGAPLQVAIIAMYRFEGGRIVEDGGISVAKAWAVRPESETRQVVSRLTCPPLMADPDPPGSTAVEQAGSLSDGVAQRLAINRTIPWKILSAPSHGALHKTMSTISVSLRA